MPTPDDFWNDVKPDELRRRLEEQAGVSVHRQTAWLWKRKKEIPSERCADVSYVTGWSFEDLRPDLFKRKIDR